jgi:hypothetical protein
VRATPPGRSDTTKNKIFFSLTQGGGGRTGSDTVTATGTAGGQIWSYDTKAQTLTCEFQSPGASVLDLPDNLTARSGAAASSSARTT